MLANRPDLAERIDMFARARAVSAANVRAHLDEPMPGSLKASVEDMIKQASLREQSGEGASSATVTALGPREKAVPRSPVSNWLMPIAASLLALISGAVGYWLATQGSGSPGYNQIATTADPELAQLLSSVPSGEKSLLAGPGGDRRAWQLR